MKHVSFLFGTVLIFSAVLLLISGCDKSEGTIANFDDLGLKECSDAMDTSCGAGRYCKATSDSHFICAADCFESKDCYNMYSLGDQQEIADNPEGVENPYYCSNYGRCILQGETDPLEVEGDQDNQTKGCADDAECVELNGDGFICLDEYCRKTCEEDTDCLSLGAGRVCSTGETSYCYIPCIDNLDCVYHGWAYSCHLPEGVVESENRYGPEGTIPANMGSYASEEGQCLKSFDAIDYGAGEDSSQPGDELLGSWGGLFTTPTTTTGIPLVNKQDTYSINHILLKVTRGEDGELYLHQKWCFIELKNFKDDTYEAFDDLAYMVTPQQYTDSIPVQVSPVNALASIDPGTSFNTDYVTEVRGAVLDDPINDPLPSRHDEATLVDTYDQDKDGNPGLTTKMVGVLQGEVYSIQRWGWSYHGNILDRDDDVLRIGGFIESNSDQPMLGSNKESMIYDTDYTPHHDHTRAYFRFQKMDDNASCEEIINLGRDEQNEGEWLQFTYHFGGDNEYGHPMDGTYYKGIDIFWDEDPTQK